jgi:peptidoglycan/LPS O-acetylase OafA/YrhL
VSASHFVPLLSGKAVAGVVHKLGAPGVTVFFVISGYLITTLLLRELQKSGTISIGAFFQRRLLRITPAYLMFVAAAALVGALGLSRVDPKVFPFLLTYTYNLKPGLDDSTIGIAWSLCVEERFYLLWPAALLLAGRARAIRVLVTVIAGAAVLRFVLHRHVPVIDLDTFTGSQIDKIAVGCVLAFVDQRETRWRGWPWGLLGAGVFFTSIFVFSRSGTYELGPKHLVEVLAIALVTHALTHVPEDPVTRFLDLPFMRLVGRLSYSLYLAHPALNAFHLLAPKPWARVALFVGYASFSLWIVEKPFLALKDHLDRRTHDATLEVAR